MGVFGRNTTPHEDKIELLQEALERNQDLVSILFSRGQDLVKENERLRKNLNLAWRLERRRRTYRRAKNVCKNNHRQ